MIYDQSHAQRGPATGVAVSTAEIGQFTHTKGHLNDRPVTRGVREPELGYQLLDNLLYDACDSGDAQRVRQLLDGPRDASEALTARGLERALQHASSQGHEDIVQILLDDGVNVDCRNGLSPLRLASTGGHDRVVQLLLWRTRNHSKAAARQRGQRLRSCLALCFMVGSTQHSTTAPQSWCQYRFERPLGRVCSV